MLVVAVMSAVFAARMWGDIFNSIVAEILVFFLWFNLIWAMERSIIIFFDNGNGKWVIATVRLVIVFFISFVNTSFAGIMVFDSEIKEVLVETRTANQKHVKSQEDDAVSLIQAKRDVLSGNVSDAENKYNKIISAQEARIDDQRKKLKESSDRLAGEIAGSVGSHVPGFAKAAQAAKEIMDADKKLLDEMISRLENQRTTCPEYSSLEIAKAKLAREDPPLLAQIEKTRKSFSEKASIVEVLKNDGYSDRYLALWGVAKKTPLLIISFFFLFFVIEALPIIMKLMANKDNYDEILNALKAEKSAEIAQNSELTMLQNMKKHNEAINPLREESLRTQLIADATIAELQTKLDDQKIARIQAVDTFLRKINTSSTSFDPETVKQIKKQIQSKLMASLN